MKIKFSIRPDSPHIFFDGELDEHTAEHVRLSLDELLQEFFEKNMDRVVLDFSKLTFMDSSGIGVLLGRFKKWGGKNMQICIKSPTNQVDRLLRLSGIYQIMPLVG